MVNWFADDLCFTVFPVVLSVQDEEMRTIARFIPSLLEQGQGQDECKLLLLVAAIITIIEQSGLTICRQANLPSKIGQ